jgi:hypothetical protein
VRALPEPFFFSSPKKAISPVAAFPLLSFDSPHASFDSPFLPLLHLLQHGVRWKGLGQHDHWPGRMINGCISVLCAYCWCDYFIPFIFSLPAPVRCIFSMSDITYDVGRLDHCKKWYLGALQRNKCAATNLHEGVHSFMSGALCILYILRMRHRSSLFV